MNFTIYKDDITVTYVSGSGLVINREGSDTGTLSVMINDTDRSNIGVGSNVSGAFYVTTDGNTYNTVYFNTTNPDSILSFDFNPNCSHGFGQQKWIGGVYVNDTCYKDKNTTLEYSITVKAQLKNNINLVINLRPTKIKPTKTVKLPAKKNRQR